MCTTSVSHLHDVGRQDSLSSVLSYINAGLGFCRVQFTPTVQHCSMATLIGLCIRVKLMRVLPSRFKVIISPKHGITSFPAAHQADTNLRLFNLVYKLGEVLLAGICRKVAFHEYTCSVTSGDLPQHCRRTGLCMVQISINLSLSVSHNV